MNSSLPILPPAQELETKAVLKHCVAAQAALAELKGVCGTIPDENIIINTLAIQEAKDSSAIENIITTHDELFKEELFSDFIANAAAKEVQNYTRALKQGYALVKQHGLLTTNTILEIQAELEKNKAGYRKLPGTALKNQQTGAIVYTPPQNPDEIVRLMTNLEHYINDDAMSAVEPLIKMAVVHHQFESIHPFYDGNGRTGRIINILYLVAKRLLDLPVLYLSRYVIEHKADYYRLLQSVRDNGDWEPWLIFVLVGVEKTACNTIVMIQDIRALVTNYKSRLRDAFKFYSQELVDNLFAHPYTKIEFIERDLQVNRKTAAKYLDELSENGFLKKEKLGTSHFYVNEALLAVFTHKGV